MIPSSQSENLGKTARQMERLVNLSVTLNSTLDPDRLLRFIIETAADLLECEAASILLYDEKRGELFFTSAVGTDQQKLAEIPVPIEGSIAGTIFTQNRPLVINDVEKDPRHYTQVGEQIQFRPRSLLGVPMRIREKVTGVLEALNKRDGGFDDADVQILSVIASQAAVAINNARLVQALQRAYDELSRLDKLKSDFLAIASHELRTPLGVVLGYATFLQEEAQGEISEHAKVVLASALRMRSIIESMTNLNLLQMMTVKLDLKTAAIQQILKSVCDELMPTAKAKCQMLTLEAPDEQLMVKADIEKLEQVFKNLLNNAIRFTPEGGEITFNASLIHGEVWVKIKDNGIGIPKNELENIFKEFYQVESHMTRRHGGLGVGLSIAKGIVELLGGRIWAESEGQGKGSTFTVVLPKYSG